LIFVTIFIAHAISFEVSRKNASTVNTFHYNNFHYKSYFCLKRDIFCFLGKNETLMINGMEILIKQIK